jgi:large subunit ribosomal protein L24e
MKCSFCSKEIKSGTGKQLIRDDARVLYFCGSKCEKNMEMGRKGRTTKWTDEFHALKAGKK